MVKSKFSKLAIASFVLGVLGWILVIFLFFYKYKNVLDFSFHLISAIGVASVFFIPIWLPAIVCGIIALIKIKKNKLLKGKKLAILGIVLASLPYILDSVLLMLFIWTLP